MEQKITWILIIGVSVFKTNSHRLSILPYLWCFVKSRVVSITRINILDYQWFSMARKIMRMGWNNKMLPPDLLFFDSPLLPPAFPPFPTARCVAITILNCNWPVSSKEHHPLWDIYITKRATNIKTCKKKVKRKN